MSNRRRPRQSRALRSWPKPGPDEAYCHQPAVVLDRLEPGSTETARQMSHDALLKQLGDRQRHGVWWTHHHPAEALRLIDDLYSEDPRREVVENMRSHLGNPRSLLVVAWCIGAVPEGVEL